MPTYTISAKVEKSTVDRLRTLAANKRVPENELAGHAIELYLALPEDLRTVLHSLAHTLDQGDTPFIMKDVIRSLNGVDTRRHHKELEAIEHALLS